jgi:hypothetical protein
MRPEWPASSRCRRSHTAWLMQDGAKQAYTLDGVLGE